MNIIQKTEYEFTEEDWSLIKQDMPINPCRGCSGQNSCCGCEDKTTYLKLTEPYIEANVVEICNEIESLKDSLKEFNAIKSKLNFMEDSLKTKYGDAIFSKICGVVRGDRVGDE